MWEKLTPDDIDRARHKLALERAETLSRHAQELRDLDIERGRIEELERLIAAFAEKYTASGASSLQPVTQSEEHAAPAVAGIADNHVSEPAIPDARQDAPSTGLAVVQHVAPNFGIPLRRIVGR
jgi:hypothetical protein